MILCRECAARFPSDDAGERDYRAHECKPRFGAAEATRKRDEAIAVVSRRAEWRRMAEDGLRRLALKGEPFTSDCLLRLVPELEACEEPRVIGAAFRVAAADALIVPTGRYVESDRIISHRRPKREWIQAPEGVW